MIKKIIITSIISLILNSCGSGGTQDRIMEIGESYSVSTGDVIVKASEEAVVQITHVSGKETSSVSLIEGNATITHPSES